MSKVFSIMIREIFMISQFDEVLKLIFSQLDCVAIID